MPRRALKRRRKIMGGPVMPNPSNALLGIARALTSRGSPVIGPNTAARVSSEAARTTSAAQNPPRPVTKSIARQLSPKMAAPKPKKPKRKPRGAY